MEFKDLKYKKPKGMVKNSDGKSGSKNSGKNIQRPAERVPKTSSQG